MNEDWMQIGPARAPMVTPPISEKNALRWRGVVEGGGRFHSINTNGLYFRLQLLDQKLHL